MHRAARSGLFAVPFQLVMYIMQYFVLGDPEAMLPLSADPAPPQVHGIHGIRGFIATNIFGIFCTDSCGFRRVPGTDGLVSASLCGFHVRGTVGASFHGYGCASFCVPGSYGDYVKVSYGVCVHGPFGDYSHGLVRISVGVIGIHGIYVLGSYGFVGARYYCIRAYGFVGASFHGHLRSYFFVPGFYDLYVTQGALSTHVCCPQGSVGASFFGSHFAGLYGKVCTNLCGSHGACSPSSHGTSCVGCARGAALSGGLLRQRHDDPVQADQADRR